MFYKKGGELMFTEQQKQNLLTFLSRVQLTGQEAGVFVELVQIIQSAKPIQPQNQQEQKES